MFIYTYPYLSYYLKFISSTQISVLVIAFLLYLYLSTPKPTDRLPSTPHSKEALRDAFLLGELPLWQIFWPFWLVLNLLVFLLDLLARNGLITTVLWDIGHLNLFLFSLWWANSIWRSSCYTTRSIWSILARFIAIITLFEFLHCLLIRIKFARDFFNCQELSLNLTSCF